MSQQDDLDTILELTVREIQHARRGNCDVMARDKVEVTVPRALLYDAIFEESATCQDWEGRESQDSRGSYFHLSKYHEFKRPGERQVSREWLFGVEVDAAVVYRALLGAVNEGAGDDQAMLAHCVIEIPYVKSFEIRSLHGWSKQMAVKLLSGRLHTDAALGEVMDEGGIYSAVIRDNEWEQHGLRQPNNPNGNMQWIIAANVNGVLSVHAACSLSEANTTCKSLQTVLSRGKPAAAKGKA